MNDAIRQYMTAQGLTQEQFAALVGVTQVAVSDWLRGGYRVSAERCIQLERATGGALRREALRPDLFAVAPPAPAAEPTA